MDEILNTNTKFIDVIQNTYKGNIYILPLLSIINEFYLLWHTAVETAYKHP